MQHLNKLEDFGDPVILFASELSVCVAHHRINASASRWYSVTACLQPRWHSGFWTVLSLWERRVLARRQLPKWKARGTHTKCYVHPVYTRPTRVDFNFSTEDFIKRPCASEARRSCCKHWKHQSQACLLNQCTLERELSSSCTDTGRNKQSDRFALL